jgi:hypothetical protein
VLVLFLAGLHTLLSEVLNPRQPLHACATPGGAGVAEAASLSIMEDIVPIGLHTRPRQHVHQGFEGRASSQRRDVLGRVIRGLFTRGLTG